MTSSFEPKYDVVLAARRYLVAQGDVVEVLGSDQEYDTWLFTDKLYVTLAGSQQCAAVLTLEGNWTSPNPYSTVKFPRLGVTMYADPQRDTNGNLTQDDTRAKLLAVHETLDQYLHRPSLEEVMWDTVRVLASTRLNEPDPRPWADGDHAASMQIFYGLGVG